MKLHQIAKGTRNVKNVPFRPSNAPDVVGDDWEKDEHTIQVGLRALTPFEASEVISKAQESALKAGAKEWLATHPLCELHLMVHLVAATCVDSEKPSEPFCVGGADDVFNAPELAGDNLAYLAQQAKQHNDLVGPRDQKLTPEQMIEAVVREAERPENAPETFFSRLRPSTQLSFFHFMAELLSSSLMLRSLSGRLESPSSTDEQKPTESENERPKPEAATEATPETEL